MFKQKIYINFSAFYSLKLTDRWLCVRTEMLGE